MPLMRNLLVSASLPVSRAATIAGAIFLVASLLVVQSASADHHLEGEALSDEEVAAARAVDAAEEDLAHAAGEHADGHGDEHEAGHGGGHSEEGPLAVQPDLGLFSLIIFGLFMLALAKLCWEPLMNGLNQRESNIRGAVDAANQARDEAAALLAEHKKRMAGVDDEVKEIIAEARRDAETTKADIIAKANSEADAARDRSLAEIERAKQQALVDLAAREQDLVISATETVLGRSIDAGDRQRLIDDALGQFASRN